MNTNTLKCTHYLKPVYLILFLLFFLDCKGQTGKSIANGEEEYTFPMITIPSTLLELEDRAAYLTLHYWDNFDFTDTLISRREKMLEQAFVDYIDIFPHTSQSVVSESIQKMLKKCEANEKIFDYFTSLYYKYLYDPNSNMRNDEYLIPALEAMLSSPAQKDKTRPELLLSLAKKNRLGHAASNFVYTMADGRQGKLYDLKAEFTLIYFYNPECENCKEVTGHLRTSNIIKGMLANKRLILLAIYSDKDLEAWRRHLSEMPKDWIIACDKSQTIDSERLYDLKAIPSIYLLDKQKKTLLKDAGFEQVEDYLSSKE
ncbi:MAG: DUF5106 domain-containing protein [Tannerellaceae bacterium]|jgi:thiol-disulfide isomerase/thioredoxin|nr:DUF5106 domain-containing protein [Tannerellaceae bacterium]